MDAHSKVTTDHLKRRAIVYIRQSSPVQVANNLESQRRQYGLADQARQLGFQQVDIIDEDLGRSGSGQVERPGFVRLVAEVCTGSVAAVFCIEASRLARNGRDWHHLIELCGLVRAIVVDPDGVYDPGVLRMPSRLCSRRIALYGRTIPKRFFASGGALRRRSRSTRPTRL